MLVKIEMIDSEIRQAIAFYIECRYGVAVPHNLEIQAKVNAIAGEKLGEYREADLRVQTTAIAIPVKPE